MGQEELLNLLNDLLEAGESELVEFKHAENDKPTALGKYVSAIANCAKIEGANCGWILLGVDNSGRVVGTNYLEKAADRIKEPHNFFKENGRLVRVEIFEVEHPEGRVLMYKIPSAPEGTPVPWDKDHYDRFGESVVRLSFERADKIRFPEKPEDWTGRTVPAASVDDLDPEAIEVARKQYADKHRNKYSIAEVQDWTVEEFLIKAQLSEHGAITNAAMILLGKVAAFNRLNIPDPEIIWRVPGKHRRREHFHLPFLTASSRIYEKITNYKLRIFPANSLLRRDIMKYDQSVVTEALHNCIAHMDYPTTDPIMVIEEPDKLVFLNRGHFGKVPPEEYVLEIKPPSRRNPYLLTAMVKLNMIDHEGSGIKTLYETQQKRCLPLPDYEFTQYNEVILTIHGEILDPTYTQLLLERNDLQMTDVLGLDRIQKDNAIPAKTARHLRSEGLIGGQHPNYFILDLGSDPAVQKVLHREVRILSTQYYEKLIISYLQASRQASKQEIVALLWDKLGNDLSESQKETKINNLLTSLRIKGIIYNAGSGRKSSWRLVARAADSNQLDLRTRG